MPWVEHRLSPAGERRVGKWRVLRIEGASVYFLSMALAAMNEIRPLADTDSDLRLSATYICIGSEQSGGLERLGFDHFASTPVSVRESPPASRWHDLFEVGSGVYTELPPACCVCLPAEAKNR